MQHEILKINMSLLKKVKSSQTFLKWVLLEYLFVTDFPININFLSSHTVSL